MKKRIKYSIEEIQAILGAHFNGANPRAIVSDLLIDSRKFSNPDEVLFVAIKGSRNDGATFIPELYEKGVRNFVLQSLPENRFLYDQANFLLVPDALMALQQLAKHHRKQFEGPVIGITGSNGKTIIKEWLFQLLQPDFKVIRSPKSYNSQVGVPLSVWNMDAVHEMAIIEAGISQPGEMQKLQEIITPDIGVFTNIGQAHGRFFNSVQQKILEKLKLFSDCKKLVYCLDHLLIKEEIQQIGVPVDKCFTWSCYHPADLFIKSIEVAAGATKITGVYQQQERKIEIPFTDKASVENALHCWAVLLLLQVEQEEVEDRMKQLVPVAMRLEMKSGVNDCLLISDVYSSDLESLRIALDFVNQQQQTDKKTLILSDMLESTLGEEALYSEVASLLQKYQVSRLLAVGPEMKAHQHLFHGEKYFYPDTKTLMKDILKLKFREENILVKGARKYAFEEVVELLAQKAHATSLEVDLNALVHNYQYYKSLLKPETKVMGMVKAFSYGTGSAEIARILQFHRLDYLGVAYVDEGVELRKHGINMPIMVMNPDEGSFDQMLRFDLEPEIYSFEQLAQFARQVQLQPSDKLFGIHLKVDTGMHRLGFAIAELKRLIQSLKALPRIRVLSVFSHLAASDQPELEAFTYQQLQTFDKAYEKIADGLGYQPVRHILNSSGVINYPDHQYEMVRLGIGLYGVGAEDKLRPVARLKTRISQIKKIRKGESVGYNRAHVAKQDALIAILPIGYADGLNRKLGFKNGYVTINKQKAKLVGAICMDMCFVDITGLKVQTGDEVEVFGDGPTIQEIAVMLDTIPYEILTSVSQRVKRVYYQE